MAALSTKNSLQKETNLFQMKGTSMQSDVRRRPPHAVRRAGAFFLLPFVASCALLTQLVAGSRFRNAVAKVANASKATAAAPTKAAAKCVPPPPPPPRPPGVPLSGAARAAQEGRRPPPPPPLAAAAEASILRTRTQEHRAAAPRQDLKTPPTETADRDARAAGTKDIVVPRQQENVDTPAPTGETETEGGVPEKEEASKRWRGTHHRVWSNKVRSREVTIKDLFEGPLVLPRVDYTHPDLRQTAKIVRDSPGRGYFQSSGAVGVPWPQSVHVKAQEIVRQVRGREKSSHRGRHRDAVPSEVGFPARKALGPEDRRGINLDHEIDKLVSRHAGGGADERPWFGMESRMFVIGETVSLHTMSMGEIGKVLMEARVRQIRELERKIGKNWAWLAEEHVPFLYRKSTARTGVVQEVQLGFEDMVRQLGTERRRWQGRLHTQRAKFEADWARVTVEEAAVLTDVMRIQPTYGTAKLLQAYTRALVGAAEHHGTWPRAARVADLLLAGAFAASGPGNRVREQEQLRAKLAACRRGRENVMASWNYHTGFKSQTRRREWLCPSYIAVVKGILQKRRPSWVQNVAVTKACGAADADAVRRPDLRLFPPEAEYALEVPLVENIGDYSDANSLFDELLSESETEAEDGELESRARADGRLEDVLEWLLQREHLSVCEAGGSGSSSSSRRPRARTCSPPGLGSTAQQDIFEGRVGPPSGVPFVVLPPDGEGTVGGLQYEKRANLLHLLPQEYEDKGPDVDVVESLFGALALKKSTPVVPVVPEISEGGSGKREGKKSGARLRLRGSSTTGSRE